MRRLIVMFAALFLSACAARNPVLREAEWNELHSKPGGAVVFSLPQARFDLSYQFVTRTFTAGSFTNVVDHCLDDSYASTKPICTELKTLGINKPLRLSDRTKNFTADQFCKKDGGQTESRRSIADGSTAAASAVPDPGEVYLIPLTRSYFQTFEISVEINPNGTIGKGSLSTENLGADEFLGLFAKLAAKFAAAKAPGATPVPTYQATRPPIPTVAELGAARAELRRLVALIARRDLLAAQNKDEALVSRSVLIGNIEAQITRAKAKFVGDVTEKTSPAAAYAWIPGAAEELHVAMEKDYDACNADPVERPRRLALGSKIDKEPGLAPLASGTVTEANLPKATGWPYRIPREAKIAWAVCRPGDGNLERSGKPIDDAIWADGNQQKCDELSGIRTLVPQFGQTLRLPAATGGRKSTVAPEYYADGSLKKVVVSHVGTSPTPLITAAQGVLLPPAPAAPPTETATLQSEAALITARQALCRLVFNVGATDPLCLGPNPPTVLPEAGK